MPFLYGTVIMTQIEAPTTVIETQLNLVGLDAVRQHRAHGQVSAKPMYRTLKTGWRTFIRKEHGQKELKAHTIVVHNTLPLIASHVAFTAHR